MRLVQNLRCRFASVAFRQTWSNSESWQEYRVDKQSEWNRMKRTIVRIHNIAVIARSIQRWKIEAMWWWENNTESNSGGKMRNKEIFLRNVSNSCHRSHLRVTFLNFAGRDPLVNTIVYFAKHNPCTIVHLTGRPAAGMRADSDRLRRCLKFFFPGDCHVYPHLDVVPVEKWKSRRKECCIDGMTRNLG